jgi:HEPN domain-containing protein
MDMDILRELAQVEGPVETREEASKRISTDQFNMVQKDTVTWLAENRKLCQMHEIAVEDYIVSRYAVLALGLFRTGLALAAQTVEKFLKCYLLAIGVPMEEVRKYRHKISLLLKKASDVSQKDQLLRYLDFCEDLEKWYNSRYPDSANSASHWARNAIPEFDRLVCYLEENIPMPETIIHLKYSGGESGHQWSSIFVRLFGDSFSQHRTALLFENTVLASQLNDLEENFLKYRLASIIPCNTLQESREHMNRIESVIRKYQESQPTV